MLLGSAMMVLFWGALIVLVVWAVRAGAGQRNTPVGPTITPLELAQRRYAMGEISREEFEQVRQGLLP